MRLDRPFAGGGFPPRFSAEVAPLLRWLERERLGYNLTTDISLARGEPPLLGDAPGVAFAGSELWLPGDLLRRLREYVAEGGQHRLLRHRLVPAHGRARRRAGDATRRGRGASTPSASARR